MAPPSRAHGGAVVRTNDRPFSLSDNTEGQALYISNPVREFLRIGFDEVSQGRVCCLSHLIGHLCDKESLYILFKPFERMQLIKTIKSLNHSYSHDDWVTWDEFMERLQQSGRERKWRHICDQERSSAKSLEDSQRQVRDKEAYLRLLLSQLSREDRQDYIAHKRVAATGRTSMTSKYSATSRDKNTSFTVDATLDSRLTNLASTLSQLTEPMARSYQAYSPHTSATVPLDESVVDRVDDMMEQSSLQRSSSESSMEVDDDIDQTTIGADVDRIHRLVQQRRAPLSNEDEIAVDNALSSPHDDTVIIEKFKIPITRLKLSCLLPNTWLNDEVINFYMQLLMERNSSQCAKNPNMRSSHYFNSFFIDRLMENGGYSYNLVRRWTKKFDIFEKEKVFIPVNISNTHWTMMVAYVQKRHIVYLDSFGGRGNRYLSTMVRYFVDEAMDKKKIKMDPGEWTTEAGVDFKHVKLPQQSNGVDCGMFSTMYADILSDDLPLDSFRQSDIPQYRRKVAAAIIRGALTYEV
eukprot:CAMPEP_0185030244 /NCGR_PEP_ID=MMETSP1103-20130426/17070_1 /TAXON_ID=36769 /ORGANISM="Paraphysomonas bandaiensis, Strain Caron Lab Isolate" /LENGTH=521 /DNA_ID=CAMNT_0027565287 /DNA_START=187 /DNA_END=1752 /DNA_ORIENTATION=+